MNSSGKAKAKPKQSGGPVRPRDINTNISVNETDVTIDVEGELWLVEKLFKGLLEEDQDEYRVIVVTPTICKLTGGGAAALVLAQLVYWNRPLCGTPRTAWRQVDPRTLRMTAREERPQPGRARWWASRREIANETGLTTRQVQHAVAKLRQLSLIDVKQRSGDRPGLKLTKATYSRLGEGGYFRGPAIAWLPGPDRGGAAARRRERGGRVLFLRALVGH